MKKLLVILIMVAVSLSLAQRANIQGYRDVTNQFIYFHPGRTDADSTTKLMVTGDATADTIWADSSDTWVQISGTADSCSYPFWLTDFFLNSSGGVIEHGTESGGNHPIQSRLLNIKIKSNVTDSNQIKFNIDTRDRIRELSYGNSWKWKWGAWTNRGFEKSGGGFTVLDTVQTDSTASITAMRQKLHFNVTGTQGRICPEVTAYYSDVLTDSLLIDSIMYQGR